MTDGALDLRTSIELYTVQKAITGRRKLLRHLGIKENWKSKKFNKLIIDKVWSYCINKCSSTNNKLT